MRAIFSEKNLVVVLFVLVFITFALAQEDSKKMEEAYIGLNAAGRASLAATATMPAENHPSPVHLPK